MFLVFYNVSAILQQYYVHIIIMGYGHYRL